jgi:hypothetical protein
VKIKRPLKNGDVRIVEKFLFLPKTINGETRWLEKAKFRQRFEFYYDALYVWEEWNDMNWVD